MPNNLLLCKEISPKNIILKILRLKAVKKFLQLNVFDQFDHDYDYQTD